MSEIVVIIGNGFDLNLGLETSYTDFLRSTQYQKLIDQESSLAEHLIKKHDLQNWIDIENELKKYSNDFFKNDNRADFKKEYLSLCSALCDYINNLDYSIIDKSSFAYKFVKKMCEEDFEATIYDFNYTEAINTIMADAERVEKLKHIKVHGSAVSNNIVFGVDDRAYINKSDSFLYKSASLHFNYDINIAKAIGLANQIVIIGHSLGETDHFYFDSFFQTQAMTHAKGKNIMVTYHSGDGLDGITKQLMEMSAMNLSGLRKMNKVVFKEI